MAEKKSEDEEDADVTVLESDPGAASALDRFLGAVAVSLFIASWLSSLASPVVFALALHRGHRFVAASLVAVTVAAYAPWEHGPVSRWSQGFLTRYHKCHYGGVTIVFEGGDVPSSPESRGRQTLFAVHPHGAFCIGWAFLYHDPSMRGVRFCFSPALYASPIFRLFSRIVNRPGSASRGAMEGYLRDGDDVALPPGGFEEATLTSTATDRVFVKRRYGFVRLCLKHGVSIRPVYAFGEGRLFGNVQGMWGPRLALNRYGIPAILVWGSRFLPLLPRTGHPLRVVVGRPMDVPRIENPTKEEVKSWHDRYILELRRMYEEHKEAAYGPEGKHSKLEVW